jgi:tRNA(Ile)-lysidine synthetase-like protein
MKILARKCGTTAPLFSEKLQQELSRQLKIEAGRHASVQLPHGMRIQMWPDCLRLEFSRTAAEEEGQLVAPSGGSESPEVPLSVPGRSVWRRWQVEMEILPAAVELPVSDPFCEVVDLDKIAGPLTIRARRQGDRFWPLGAAGEKKLKEFFRERRIPIPQRSRHPLLVDADSRIVWVVGGRLSQRVRVSSETRRFGRLMAKPIDG